MPSFGVYLPDDLAAEVRRLNIPMSAVCQQAVREEIERRKGHWATQATVDALIGSLQLQLAQLALALRGPLAITPAMLRLELDAFEVRFGKPSERLVEAFVVEGKLVETPEFHRWSSLFAAWRLVTEARTE